MKKTNALILNKRDYEIYDIPLPFSACFGKRKTKILNAELSKRHPCFSDSCSFDSKVSFSKEGFFAKVVVINNYNLRKYEQNSSKMKIYSEELKNKVLFREPIWKKYKSFVFATLFLIVAAFFVFCISRKKTIIQKESINQDTFLEKKILQRNIEVFEIVKSFFGKIKLYGGLINSFSWNLEGFSEKISASVKNIYPEKFLDLTDDVIFSALTFSKGIPMFSINGSNYVSLGETQGETREIPREKIRKLIQNYKGLLIQETVEPYEIQFDVPLDFEIEKKRFFRSFKELGIENHLFPTKVLINHQKENLYRVSLGFNKFESNNLSYVFEIIDSFFDFFEISKKVNSGKNTLSKSSSIQKKNQEQKRQMESLDKNPSKNNVSKDYQTPFGKVVHDDGSISSFYRNKDGKIEIRKEK